MNTLSSLVDFVDKHMCIQKHSHNLEIGSHELTTLIDRLNCPTNSARSLEISKNLKLQLEKGKI